MSRKVPAPQDIPPERPSVGASLKAARRRRRISLDRAAAETRIRRDFLARMEAGDFSFTAPGYVGHFLRSYARLLRIEADPLVDELDTGGDPASGEARALATSLHVTAHPYREPAGRSRWIVWGAGALLVALLITGLFVDDSNQAEPDGATREVSEAVSTPGADGSRPDRSVPGAGLGKVEAPDPERSPKSALTRVELVASTARCWVEAVADGETVFRGMLELGQSRRFTAHEGMQLVLGFPAGVRLVVNGRDYGSPGGEEVRTIAIPDDLDVLAGERPPAAEGAVIDSTDL